MRLARSTFLLGLSIMIASTVPLSCNTKAIGIDECRDIEYARCEVGVNCKTVFDIDDVKACKRFYRDQCLHGMDVTEVPGKPEVNQCIDRIRILGGCAQKTGEDTLVSKCADSTTNDDSVRTVCELLKKPQNAPECSFLVNDTSNAGGSGGGGGTAGSAGNGGSAGSGGTAGGGGTGGSS
jgi:uncharacterized membrane protein YgcG